MLFDASFDQNHESTPLWLWSGSDESCFSLACFTVRLEQNWFQCLWLLYWKQRPLIYVSCSVLSNTICYLISCPPYIRGKVPSTRWHFIELTNTVFTVISCKPISTHSNWWLVRHTCTLHYICQCGAVTWVYSKKHLQKVNRIAFSFQNTGLVRFTGLLTIRRKNTMLYIYYINIVWKCDVFILKWLNTSFWLLRSDYIRYAALFSFSLLYHSFFLSSWFSSALT